ncbi:MAG: hypothetical protein AAF564_00530 [Bacteroidota bacterium]
MKNMDTKERFIELRARSYSFDKIAEELDVSKPTLIKWHKEFEREIVNLRYIHVEGLLEKHGLLKQKKIEVLAEVLQRTLDEIRTRDLSDVSVKHLIEITKLVDDRLEKEFDGIVYLTKEFTDPLQSLIDNSMTRTIRLGE